MTSIGSLPRKRAISDSLFPWYCLFACVRTPTTRTPSGPPTLWNRLSHPPEGFSTSLRMRSRSAGSLSRATSLATPPSDAVGGRLAASPVEEAG